MMKDSREIISEVLDLDHDNLTEITEYTENSNDRLPAIINQKDINDSDDKKIDNDADYIRGNIKDAINKGFNSLDELLLVAEQSGQARAYEVISTMLRTLVDANESLFNIHEKKKKIKNINTGDKSKPKEGNNTNIDKAVFIGSTSELSKFLQDKNKK